MILGRVQIDECQLARQELAWRLAEDSRAIARPTVGPARAAMHHRRGSREGEFDHAVRGGTAEICKKTHAASVVLFQRIRNG